MGGLRKLSKPRVERDVPVAASRLQALIEGELTKLGDDRIAAHVGSLLVEPVPVLRPWDYGEAGEKFITWTVLFDRVRSETGIAYCEHGFGPEAPWGLVFQGDDETEPSSIGMDSQWFPTFVEAYLSSFAATELPIWRVFATNYSSLGPPLTPEVSWEEAWARCAQLQENDPGSDYVVAHPAQWSE